MIVFSHFVNWNATNGGYRTSAAVRLYLIAYTAGFLVMILIIHPGLRSFTAKKLLCSGCLLGYDVCVFRVPEPSSMRLWTQMKVARRKSMKPHGTASQVQGQAYVSYTSSLLLRSNLVDKTNYFLLDFVLVFSSYACHIYC
jgi:hypothetical protein